MRLCALCVRVLLFIGAHKRTSPQIDWCQFPQQWLCFHCDVKPDRVSVSFFFKAEMTARFSFSFFLLIRPHPNPNKGEFFYICCAFTHMVTQALLIVVWSSVILYYTYTYIYSHLNQGKQTVLGSSSPSSHPAWINTKPISASVQPLTSHHFTDFSLSTSLFSLQPIIILRKARLCLHLPSLRAETQWQHSRMHRRAEEISQFDKCGHICGRFSL